ncbi:MAG TPA: amidohydrolase family protein [Draconibacterium sp.]|nr:amidohydrolase family protein [Draconibacterium sp.]
MFIEGLNYQSGQPIRVEVRNGKINAISSFSGPVKQLPIVAPGLVDLQVNGYGGIDFNTIPFTENDVLRLVKKLAQQGITQFLPTIITNSDEAIKQGLKTIVQACKFYPEVNSVVAGIHLEGPFLSEEDGSRGAHDRNFVQKPDWNLFQEWQSAAEGKIKIITLSPEWEGAAEFIKKCFESGVIVSIGHTAASSEQIAEAVEAGARLSTHLGNGAQLMLPRHPNYIWEQLAQDQLWATVIADGFHLPDSFLKVVFRMKPETSILISDCTQFAGLAPGIYKSHIGGEVLLNPEGRLCMAENPELLAGSAQSLLWCVNQVIRKELLGFEQAWNRASLKPMELLTGKTQTAFEIGQPANLVLLSNETGEIEIQQTIGGGKILFSNSNK